MIGMICFFLLPRREDPERQRPYKVDVVLEPLPQKNGGVRGRFIVYAHYAHKKKPHPWQLRSFCTQEEAMNFLAPMIENGLLDVDRAAKEITDAFENLPGLCAVQSALSANQDQTFGSNVKRSWGKRD